MKIKEIIAEALGGLDGAGCNERLWADAIIKELKFQGYEIRRRPSRKGRV